MIASDTPLDIKRLRRKLPRLQATFRTPLKDLSAFTEVFVTTGNVVAATAFIENEVFEPTNLIRCLAKHSVPPELRRSTLIATNRNEASSLLQALWGDWLDFFFLPEPGPR